MEYSILSKMGSAYVGKLPNMYVQSYIQTPESCPELLQEPWSRSASGAGLLLKFGLGPPLKWIEFGVDGDLIVFWGIPYSIYLKGL